MKRAWAFGFGLLAVLFLSTCGGGGGGSSLQYTGLTTPAAINDTNAVEIALAAWYGGEMTDISFLPTLGVGEGGTGGSRPFQVVPLIRTIRKLAGSIGGQDISTVPGQASPMMVYPINGRIPGVLGYVDVSGTYNDQTGILSGWFSFQDYDDGSGMVLSGRISFVGTTFDILFAPEPTFLDLAISTAFFSITDGIGTVRIGGTMSFQFNVPTGPVIAVLDLVTRDEGTGKTVWIDNYTVVASTGFDLFFGSYTEETISGRIYLHDHGFVDIETIAPFRIYDIDLFPSSGSLVVTGNATGGGYCRARLDVIDNLNYSVLVDANGDGFYEATIPGSW